MSVAYLSNQFPEPLEPYVWEEICELRKRGCSVMPCGIRRPVTSDLMLNELASETLYVFPLRWWPTFKASWLCVRKFGLIADLIWRAIRGPEPVSRRCRTLAHTWLGAYLATLLRGQRIRHIHVHHGYFAAWVAMAAARFSGGGFSMTLHGSDLLVRADYLDSKLENCRFCITVSAFNRQYISKQFPKTDPSKTFVQRLGINPALWHPQNPNHGGDCFSILSVGRLHPVKNHGFLLLACAALKAQNVSFRCVIAGEGEERGKLEQLITELDLRQEVTMFGYVLRERLPDLYAEADVVALTSRSEGLPVTLMEAMAMERLVLAPAITGIPELVTDGVTGFLYQPNSMEDFLAKLHSIRVAGLSLDVVRRAARRQVELHFNSRLNLAAFTECFLKQLGALNPRQIGPTRIDTHENPVLQQVQLRFQRDRSLSV